MSLDSLLYFKDDELLINSKAKNAYAETAHKHPEEN
ncbi:hypothetical protein M2254_001215 [Chryseobacterium sp. BIGb0186]|nr:hypothetical protein [Chryseobacterium sp. JUb44]MDH6209631.1 hypothetical protein [Chryseobacterium sp. BIGb0186]